MCFAESVRIHVCFRIFHEQTNTNNVDPSFLLSKDVDHKKQVANSLFLKKTNFTVVFNKLDEKLTLL